MLLRRTTLLAIAVTGTIAAAVAIVACSLVTDVPDLTSGNKSSASSSGSSGTSSGSTSSGTTTSSGGKDASFDAASLVCTRKTPALHFEDNFDKQPPDGNWTSSEVMGGATFALENADAGGTSLVATLSATTPGARAEMVKTLAVGADAFSHLTIELDLFADIPANTSGGLPSGNSTDALRITLESPNPELPTTGRSLVLEVGETRTSLYVSEDFSELQSDTKDLSKRILPREWTHVRIETQIACNGAFAKVSLNGTEQLSTALAPIPPGLLRITLTNRPTSTDGTYRLVYDNVKVDYD